MTDRKRTGLGCLPAFAICLIGLVVALYAVWPSDEEMAAERSKALANAIEITLTADEFVESFDTDDAAARARYDGNILNISGKVKGSRPDNSDGAVLSFATKSGSPLDANVDGEDKVRALELRSGDSVSVRCTGLLNILGARVPHGCRLK